MLAVTYREIKFRIDGATLQRMVALTGRLRCSQAELCRRAIEQFLASESDKPFVSDEPMQAPMQFSDDDPSNPLG